MANKINFERFDDLEYEPSGSEEEYSKEEINLLKNVRNRGKKKEAVEEVFAFDDSDDDDDDDNQDLIGDSDIEDNRHDDNIPDSRAWGKRKSAYYHTDFVDQDYSTYNEKDEELALQEEEEAKAIQQRLAKQLEEVDFSLDVYTDIKDQDLEKIDDDRVEVKFKSDVKNLSQRQKQQLFQKDSPEFFGLVQDFERYIQESRDVLQPFLKYIKNYELQSPTIHFAETLNNVIMTYCTNIAFYVTLKTKRISIKNHPIAKRLLQIRQILQQLEQKYNDVVKSQLIKVIEASKTGTSLTFTTASQNPSEDNANKKSKNKRKLNAEDEMHDESESEDDQEITNGEEDSDEPTNDDNDERRAITYQIAKNKGLTPHRKKELRNPRVKHRNKYRKALIRRKGAVRAVRKELKRYDGEISGIKATVKKSVKIKS